MENTDLGLILKENSLDTDKERLSEEVIKYINSWDDRIKSEKKFLMNKKVNLVVSDIVPWVFKASKELEIERFDTEFYMGSPCFAAGLAAVLHSQHFARWSLPHTRFRAWPCLQVVEHLHKKGQGEKIKRI